MYQCRSCCKVILRKECPSELHQCDTVKCPSCKRFATSDEHFCFLKKTEPKESSDELIYFDFETEQSSGTHIVNFAVAQYANVAEAVFKGFTACDDFCSWLFTPKHKNYTAIAHNMKG